MTLIDFNTLCSRCPGYGPTCCRTKTTALLRGAAATHSETVNQAVREIQSGLNIDETVMFTNDAPQVIKDEMVRGGWLTVYIRKRSDLWTMAGTQ